MRPGCTFLLACCAMLAGCVALPDDPVSPSRGGGGPGGPSPWDGGSDPRLVAVLGDPGSTGRAEPGRIDAPVTAVDLDGDGTKEIVATSKDRNVYVYSATTGHVLATLPTKYPTAWWTDRVLNQVTVGVLTPGEPPTLVVASPAAYVAAWRYDPTGSTPDVFRFERLWERRLDDCHREASMDAAPILADLDGDGRLEVVTQTEEVGLFALDTDGSLLWKQCWGGGNGAPAVDDLDGDGDLEAVFGSDDGRIAVLDGATGAPLWTFDAKQHGIRPASIPVTPTVAELDGKAPKEVLFTARYAPADDPDAFDDYHMAVFAVHQSTTTWRSEVVWMRQPAWANPMSYTHLLVDDVDGDGRTDVYGMDWNTIGHKPGAWQNLGPGNVFRLDAEGNDVWVRPMDSWWSNKDIALTQIDDDADVDLLVNAPRGGTDGLWRLDAATGEPEGFLPTPEWQVVRGPQVVDLWGDGSVGLLVPVEPMDGGSGTGAVLVYRFDRPAGG